ncbi:hypothetical protein [Clostridium estertheticum]|nr:hypothetical protein [Clostridium estertheticum]
MESDPDKSTQDYKKGLPAPMKELFDEALTGHTIRLLKLPVN